MKATALTLVSCIMPTYNRRQFVPHAIRYFLSQDYENKELIVIDDGTDCVEDLIPDINTIHYYRLDKKITLGAKLNLACRYAEGSIIANWDDDDWYSTRRLTYQVDTLQTKGTEVCGINNLLYYDLRNHRAHRYIYPPDQRTWLLGSSLCYTKKLWERNHFADINVGMDGLFVWATTNDRITVLSDSTIAVHMIHDNNVSLKKTNEGWWHTHPVEEIAKIMQNDWGFYNKKDLIIPKQHAQVHQNLLFQTTTNTDQHVPLQNVYACLVHEREDCIIDLLQNLRYHDPDSIIILYNGGENTTLFQNHSAYKKYDAVIYPKPIRLKHGYLHHFALDCMQYALENFSFNSFTIVDSDQLCLRSGYTAYVNKFLSSNSGIGMLSSMPERVAPDNKLNFVAIQAFKELDLWKPFLRGFTDGETKFVHWSFWPSTVFTRDAIRDLTALFNKNTLLQEIMKQTKIWASEEVILPTLVRLLGYEIVANPCSYNFVNYRKTYTLHNINQALDKTDVYWIHPIERQYNHPLRKFIRERLNNYQYEDQKNVCTDVSSQESFLKSSVLARIKKVEGWLSDIEAELLITITQKVCKDLATPHNIVEIGSYHGKSTILFGSVVKEHFPEARIYAIDPHDGKLGAADQGLQSFPPSFENFKRNIENIGLSEYVEIIKDNSYNVVWKKPVSLLFIDGLHDYMNVSRDFNHFSPWLTAGGYVAFHDYANYFPGVRRFVDKLLKTNAYVRTNCVESLMVLKKL